MEEETLRKPDENKTEQLISSDTLLEFSDADFELQNAIEQSQRDFWIWKERLEKEDTERQRLKKELAYPMSRLKLWQKNCTDPLENFFLDFMILRVNHCIFNDWETLPILPSEYHLGFHRFMDKNIRPSFLYNDIYRICENDQSSCYVFVL